MKVLSFGGKTPAIDASAFVADGAVIIGDVSLCEIQRLVQRRVARRQRADRDRCALEFPGRCRVSHRSGIPVFRRRVEHDRAQCHPARLPGR